ncbi:MAG TPA: WG repeat-containing protein, partial [Sideroxyarcus sp.]|nr:WG repeat-containing protein [Sideroxyarcus sp.]
AFPFSEGIAVIWDHRSYIDDDHWSYIDKTGKPAFQGQWRSAGSFKEGVAPVLSSDGKWSYIDHDGKPAFAGVYDAAMPFCGGVAAVETFVVTGPVPNMPCRADMRKGKHGMIDHTGRYIWREPEDHEYAGDFCE